MISEKNVKRERKKMKKSREIGAERKNKERKGFEK